MGLTVLERLREATARTPYYSGTEKDHIHLLFSPSGFSEELERLEADEPHLLLVGPDALLAPAGGLKGGEQ